MGVILVVVPQKRDDCSGVASCSCFSCQRCIELMLCCNLMNCVRFCFLCCCCCSILIYYFYKSVDVATVISLFVTTLPRHEAVSGASASEVWLAPLLLVVITLIGAIFYFWN
jgi:hypothetical protein